MRLSALITTSLVLVLGLSLMPAASAQDATAGGEPELASSPAQFTTSGPVVDGGAGGWDPGELDVDWAAFADEHRSDYQSSQWASAADDQRRAREDLRAQAVAEYQDATGSAGAAEFSDLEPARTGVLAKQYYDECDDGSNLPDGGAQYRRELLFGGGGDGYTDSYNPANPDAPQSDPPPQIDLRSTFILQSTDDAGRFDQTAFLVYACQEWTVDNLGAGGISFGLYVDFEGEAGQYPTVLGDDEAGPDFIVSLFPEHNVPSRPLQIMAVRTPTRDPSTWTMTFLDEAQRLDNYEIDGVVPTSAIGDFTANDGFAWTVEVVDTQQPVGGRDWFPERNYQLQVGSGDSAIAGVHVPQFPVPDDCGTQTESGDYALTPQAVTPNDDGYPFQWYHPQIRTPDAWDTIRDSSTGGRSRPVTVAVIDTGIDSTRFDFYDGGTRVVGGLDAVYGLELEGDITRDINGDPAIGPFFGPNAVGYESIGAFPRNSDRDPHGTGVASVLGARGGNTFGIAGMDWGVRLMPIRVLDVNGCISAAKVADGVKWAVDHGADLINISLARPETTGQGGGDGNLIVECNDGVDNDGDGLADDEDPGCTDEQDGSEGPRPSDPNREEQVAACSDGRDNDDDDDIDMADDDCESPADNSESPTSALERPAEPLECADGIDNDGDGLTDETDPGCDGPDDGSEGPGPDSDLPADVPACSDGRDNNDTDSYADELDPQCDNPEDDNEGREAESRTVDPLREVIDYSLEQGVPVLAASGNYGSSGDPVTYPAAYPGVLTVGSTDRTGDVAFYSSTGRWVDLVAPGGSNTRTLSGDLAVLWELDRIRSAAGTSFSTPMATGAASLYLGLNPHIQRGFTPATEAPDPATNFPDLGYQRTVDDVRIGLQNGVRDMVVPGHDTLSGWGMLDVDRMLDVQATGGPLVDPARLQLPRTEANSVIEAAEGIALSRPQEFFPYVVFARMDVAVDALAASPMLADGPLLVSRTDAVAPSTMAVLDEVLADDGRVYLLGGEAALSTAVEEQIRDAGYEVVRLAGDSRFETSVVIAEEVRSLWGGGDQVGVVRADGGDNPTAQWADALTGGAWAANTRTPMVVTSTGSVHPDVAAALQRWGTTSTVLFGGEAALSGAVEQALPGPRRIAGASRADTAAVIADQMWSESEGYLIANGYYARGWAPALAAAGLAADTDRPLLYTGASTVPDATADLLRATCPDPDGVLIIGGASLVTGSAESALMEAITC